MQGPVMHYALSCFLVASLIALWSLVVWVLHALAAWTISNAAALTGEATDASALPDWLEAWVPTEITQWLGQLLTEVRPLVDGLLQAVPALEGGLTVAAWVAWGLGTVLLLLLGAGLHLLIALWRSQGAGAGPRAGGAPQAAS
ncbi:hypothetical protein ACS5PK_05080 [Roseateles sp. DB2]|uniref:hypothetical protein n=1 Tax=Roseateles sp. DB2 TaxID=3453717 RepID=UPI003EEC98EB